MFPLLRVTAVLLGGLLASFPALAGESSTAEGTADDGFVPELPEERLNRRDLLPAIDAFQEAFGGPLVLAAAGPEGEAFLQDLVERAPDSVPVEVARLPYGGDAGAEMRRVLERLSMDCGLRVTGNPMEGWRLAAHGDCTAHERELERLLLEESAGDAFLMEELARDFRDVDLDHAVFGSALEEYRVRRLVRTPLGAPSRERMGAEWVVRDGRGIEMSAVALARQVGDVVTGAALARERERADRRRLVQLGLGAGLVAAGGAVFATAGSHLPHWRDYEVGRFDFATEERYLEAQEQAREEYEAARDAVSEEDWQRRETRRLAGVFLAGAGGMALVTVPLVRKGIEEKQRHPALYYTQARAQAWIDRYNRELREDLGLDGLSSGPDGSPSPELYLRLGPRGIALQGRFP